VSDQRLYASLPVALQNAACTWYGWKEARVRFGPAFERRLAELEESDRWSVERISAHQDERVAALVEHAYRSVPFYRRRLDEHGLTPSDVRSRAQLGRLPLLTKEDVRAHRDDLIARDVRDLVQRHTSGTTGTALRFHTSRDAIAFQWAVWWRHRRRFGLDRSQWHVNFTGKLVVPLKQRRPPYWRWNSPMHQALVNMQQLTPAKIGPIIDFLGAPRFEYWSGYPSIVHALALTARDAGLELERQPRVVSTGAEKMHAFQRREIAAFTGATLTDQYGLSEGCGNASQCERFAYHEDFEFGVLECVDPESLGDGRVRGRIVCTGFACPEFPFLRYETGDVGLWEPEGFRCACGRESRVLVEVEGRHEDYVVTPEGGRIMRFDYVFKDALNVKEAQVVQESPGAVAVRVVRRNGYGAADERALRDAIGRWISPRLDVEFEYVDAIEREPSCKFRAVKSLLPESRY
jgi:phenylacetate-CoA ligase